MTNKKPIKGPYLWYAGYPNLIEYSLQYNRREIKNFKELNDRCVELDVELQKLTYSKEAVKTLANYVFSLESGQFDKKLVAELYELVGKAADEVDNRLSVVELELEFTSAAKEEWKDRERKSTQEGGSCVAIVEQSA